MPRWRGLSLLDCLLRVGILSSDRPLTGITLTKSAVKLWLIAAVPLIAAESYAQPCPSALKLSSVCDGNRSTQIVTDVAFCRTQVDTIVAWTVDRVSSLLVGEKQNEYILPFSDICGDPCHRRVAAWL